MRSHRSLVPTWTRLARSFVLGVLGLPLGIALVALGIALVVLVPRPVRAQETSDSTEPPGYAALLDGALAEFQASRWAEARALFQRAHESYPNARTLRGIGMASFEMADYPAAIEALEGALTSEVRPLTEEQRTQVSALLERARALIGHFVVPAAGEDVRLSVDGVLTRPEGDWPRTEGRLALGVGSHEILLRDSDGRTARVRLSVRGGEDTRLDVVPPGSEIAGSTSSDAASDPGPWILAGAGAALVLTGAILHGVGASDIAAVNSAPAGTEWSSVSGVYDTAPVLTGTGIAALVAGSTMVVIGVGWGLAGALSSDGGDRRRARARLELRPTGLVLRGSF
jgi:hypothetical protein